MAEEQYKVVRNDHTRQMFFAGSEKSAREYVENHFPHVHNEPGALYGEEGPQADVLLVSPSGDEEQFRGGEWGGGSTEAEEEYEDEEEES